MTDGHTYLERYKRGEREQVWDELVTLGAGVREEPVYLDALDVARETMRRVRHNIDQLIPLLAAIGYQFGYGWLPSMEQKFAAGNPAVHIPPGADMVERVAQLEQLAGTMPLSLRAFYETVGSVNFVGAPPERWRRNRSDARHEESDPLYVCDIEAALSEFDEWKSATEYYSLRPERGPGPYRVPIAPDALHKYNISGGMWYNIALPNPEADAELDAEPHNTTFVNYLRICFRWGGFPGWSRMENRPDADLAFLTEGLLPI